MKTKQELIEFIQQIEFDREGYPINLLCKYDRLNETIDFKEVVFINLQKFMTEEWQYQIKSQKQYRPYTEAKTEWVGQTIIRYDGRKYVILSIMFDGKWLVEYNDEIYENLEYLFKNFTWADGSQFGEEV